MAMLDSSREADQRDAAEAGFDVQITRPIDIAALLYLLGGLVPKG
nr:hypothetical protein [Paraburkholderia phosphatilytica]